MTKTKKKKGKGFHVRFRPGTIEWLEGQIDDDKDCVPAVVREIVEEKRKATHASTPTTPVKK